MSNATPQWTPRNDFAERLAIVRIRRGWNVKEAALACGLSPSTWAAWEAGRKPPDMLDVAHKIADHSGCSLMWLLGLDTSAGPNDGYAWSSFLAHTA